MIRPAKTVVTLLLAGLLALSGCAWFRHGPGGEQTLLDVKTYGRYAKIVALAVYDGTGTGQSELVRQLQAVMTARFQKTLGRARLVKKGDSDFPDYLEVLPSTGTGRLDNMALAQAARLDGFQALVMASLDALVPQSEKEGMFWWRKDRFYLLACLRAEIFDPVTAAKPICVTKEIKIKIEQEDFDFFKNQDWRLPEAVQQIIVKQAKAVTKRIAKALDRLQWQITVTAVSDGRAVLPAGSRAGVQTGDRMAVFGVHRVVTGVDGEAFVVPGYRKGTVEVEKVEPDYCEVKISGPVAVGDIAVPVR